MLACNFIASMSLLFKLLEARKARSAFLPKYPVLLVLTDPTLHRWSLMSHWGLVASRLCSGNARMAIPRLEVGRECISLCGANTGDTRYDHRPLHRLWKAQINDTHLSPGHRSSL